MMSKSLHQAVMAAPHHTASAAEAETMVFNLMTDDALLAGFLRARAGEMDNRHPCYSISLSPVEMQAFLESKRCLVRIDEELAPRRVGVTPHMRSNDAPESLLRFELLEIAMT